MSSARRHPWPRAGRRASSRARRRQLRTTLLLLLVPLASALACWEQWSNDWFPQMKWQPAVQAYERTMHDGRVDPFEPPDGALPVGASPPLDPEDEEAQNALVNPRPMSLESLENGRSQFDTYCATCHGALGLGDGPVSLLGDIRGPFVGVLAVGGPGSIAKLRSDGHIYSTIRYGRRRMPSYQRIPSQDRWDIVNYIRYLNGQKGVTP